MPTKTKNTSSKSRSKSTPSSPKETSRRSREAILMTGSEAATTSFGACGGRPILSALERDVCDRLTGLGVAHSHRPRHFEVRLEDESLAAYAPTIVIRGRGREGKTVVVETLEEAQTSLETKILAFRRQYGVEFYVCLAAPEEVLDDVHFDAYDEAAATTDIHTLISRLAD